MNKVIGLVGGVVGGWAFTQYVDENMVMGAIGAYVGSVILNEVVGLFQGGLKR